MPIMIREIKTADSISAFNRIKSATKREVHDVSLDIPKVFRDKKQYMQSDEFLNDPHNRKMFALGDSLIESREQIASEIQEYNKNSKSKLAQAINGYARIKSFLQSNVKLNFWKEPTHFNYLTRTSENKYYFTKLKMHNVSRSAIAANSK